MKPSFSAPLAALLLVFSSLGTLTYSELASAEEALSRREGSCAPDYDGPRQVAMEHDGRPGVWTAASVMACMVRDLQELSLVWDRLELLEAQLELRDEQVTTLRRSVQLGLEAEERLQNAIEHAEAGRHSAESRLDVWWRSPALWVGVGVVVSTALVAISAWALSKISEHYR
jgi:hypothetical protein